MKDSTSVVLHVDRVMGDISRSDVERVASRLRELGWEKVVRCRDCKHFSEDRRDTSIGWVGVFVCDSEQWSTSSLMPSHKVDPDGYCAWGEQREVE